MIEFDYTYRRRKYYITIYPDKKGKIAWTESAGYLRTVAFTQVNENFIFFQQSGLSASAEAKLKKIILMNLPKEA